MKNPFDHLRETVAESLGGNAPMAAAEALVDGFRVERPSQEVRLSFHLDYPTALTLRAAAAVLRAQGFEVATGVETERALVRGRFERDLAGTPWLAALGSRRRDWRLNFDVEVTAGPDRKVRLKLSRQLASWAAQFSNELAEELRRTNPADIARAEMVEAALRPAPLGERVLVPGEMLSGPFRGTLRDYSGCATEPDTRDLRAGGGGALPLGRQMFVGADGVKQRGSNLYLNPNRFSGALREHQGTLICAPQNSGKTELLVHWARAANRAGYNLFLVDVKGNLLRRLTKDAPWQGEIYHFTTDPLQDPDGDGESPCHALNFLEGIDPWSRLGMQQVRQLAEAILPQDGLDQGEARIYRANWVNWLTTFIQLVLLDEFHAPFPHRKADLGDVCELASDEGALRACLNRIAVGEAKNLAEGRYLPEPRLGTLFAEIAVLLPMEEIVPEFGDTDRLLGSRAEHSYRWLTESLAGVLRPFRSWGLLGQKISGAHDLPRFRLEWVAGLDEALQPTRRQVTVVLAARAQEGDDARTILTLAVAKLQHALLERMRHTGDPAMRPVLLLLDETRRIRNFRTNEYVSYAREAEAGCVVAYQSLDQIGDERQIAELLENIGTQIYLGSLVRNTARHFVESLPKRHRPTFAVTGGGDGAGAVQIGQETIDYLSTADLYVLPAGRFPALVQLNDQPRRRPILVSLDKADQD